MKPQILITGETFCPNFLEILQKHGYKIEFHSQLLTERSLIHALHDKHAYILGGLEHISAKAIRNASRLKIIAIMGVGYQSFVDIEAATHHGIIVTNTPGVNSRSVAEMTFALILSLKRKIPFLNTLTKTGHWQNNIITQELSTQTLGIIGMGNIGSSVAKIANNGLNMKILYANPTPCLKIEQQFGAIRVSLESLLSSSDIITLHCSLTSKTQNLLGIKQLKSMKNTAILINTARPQIINPYALYNALTHKYIAGCAMDGYYLEPAPHAKEDPYKLLQLPDECFLITSHLAYLTQNSIQRMCDLAVNSVINILNGQNWPYIVNSIDKEMNQ